MNITARLCSLCLLLLLLPGLAVAQESKLRPLTVGQQMPTWSLPVYQGGQFELGQLRGRNVMLVFLRGLAGEDHWCHICHYQYAELAQLFQESDVRKELNLEIAFVLPYTREQVGAWVQAFPAQMRDIDQWKNPPNLETLDQPGRDRVQRSRALFPRSFHFEEGSAPLPVPLLVDADRAVSGGLGFFTTEWGNSTVDQNIPAVLILDEEGILRFKYISQSTLDRPGFEYLWEFLRKMVVAP